LDTYETHVAATARQDSSATEQAGEKVQQAAGAALEKAQQTAGQARWRLRDQVNERSTQVGERVAGSARDARSVGEHLRGQGKERPAELADQVAQRAESLGNYLQRADGDTILRDVERFGRERPWAVMAGGLVLGLAASRFLKASSARRYGELHNGDGAYARPTRRPVPAPPVSSPGVAGAPTATPVAPTSAPVTPEPDRPIGGAGVTQPPPASPRDR
jgi:hypothetical protein